MPVLSVRLKLRAIEEARLEAERLAALEAAAAEEEERKKPTTPSYLTPLNKRVRERTMAEPPPRIVLLRKARAKADAYSAVKRRDTSASEGGGTASRGRSATPRRLADANTKRAARGTARNSRSVPAYMKRHSRRTPARTHNTGHSALGRLKNGGKVLWGPGKSIDKRLEAVGSRSQRRTARGRSSSASRNRGGASRAWRGHVSKGRSSHLNKSRSGRSGSKSARRANRSISPSRSTWPAMSTVVQAVAPPSRLRLRATQ